MSTPDTGGVGMETKTVDDLMQHFADGYAPSLKAHDGWPQSRKQFMEELRALIAAARADERAQVAERVKELENELNQQRLSLADCVQHAEAGWQGKQAVKKNLDRQRAELLGIFSTVIATPEKGYAGEPVMLSSDASQICRELRAARTEIKKLNSELATMQARLPELVERAARKHRAILARVVDPAAIITEWQAQSTPTTQEPTATHRHIKGGLYRLLHHGRIEANMTPVAIYQSCETGQVWVRPLAEFIERFDTLGTAPVSLGALNTLDESPAAGLIGCATLTGKEQV